MKPKLFVDRGSVDPNGRDLTFDYILKNAMGNESTQDQTFVSSDIGPVLTSPDGTEYRITVDNNGNLSTEEV